MNMDAGFEVLSLFTSPIGLHVSKMLAGIALLVSAVLIAKALQAALVYVLKLIKINALSDMIGLTDVIKKAGLSSSLTALCGDIFFWAVVLAGGLKIAYFLGMVKAIVLTRIVVGYLSFNVVYAVFVLVLASIAGAILSGLILFIGALIFLPGYRLIARVAQYVAVIYGIVLALEKLGISTAVFLARPDIILGFFALAGAIAFGLGCKDLAAGWLANFLREK